MRTFPKWPALKNTGCVDFTFISQKFPVSKYKKNHSSLEKWWVSNIMHYFTVKELNENSIFLQTSGQIKGSGSCHIAGNIKPCSKEAVYHETNHLCSWQAVLLDIILGTRQIKFRHLYKILIIELSNELWIKIWAM